MNSVERKKKAFDDSVRNLPPDVRAQIALGELPEENEFYMRCRWLYLEWRCAYLASICEEHEINITTGRRAG